MFNEGDTLIDKDNETYQIILIDQNNNFYLKFKDKILSAKKEFLCKNLKRCY